VNHDLATFPSHELQRQYDSKVAYIHTVGQPSVEILNNDITSQTKYSSFKGDCTVQCSQCTYTMHTV